MDDRVADSVTRWCPVLPRQRRTAFHLLGLFLLLLAFLVSCSVLNVEKDAGPTDGKSGPPKIVISKVVFKPDMGPPIPDNCPAYDIWLKNVGGETACGIEATIEGKSYSVLYDCLLPGASSAAYMSDFFAICIPAEAIPGSTLTFTLLINDDSGHHWKDTFSIEVQ